MASIAEVCRIIEQLAPLSLSREMIAEHGCYDNSGLLIAPCDGVVTRVLCALDAGEATVLEAVERGCEMILTHHPLIYAPAKRLIFNEYPDRVILRLAKEGISLYSAHLNLDVCPKGINAALAQKIGLQNAKPCEVTTSGGGDFYVGEIAETKLDEFIVRLKKCLPAVYTVVGDGEKPIKRVGVLNGGGGSLEYVRRAHAMGLDAYLSGDLRHESMIYARETGLALIGADHYNLERFYMQELCRLLSGRADVTFLLSEREESPFRLI